MGSPDFVRKMVPILRARKLTFFDTNLPKIKMKKEGLVSGVWGGDETSPVQPWQRLENGQAVVVHDAAFSRLTCNQSSLQSAIRRYWSNYPVR